MRPRSLLEIVSQEKVAAPRSIKLLRALWQSGQRGKAQSLLSRLTEAPKRGKFTTRNLRQPSVMQRLFSPSAAKRRSKLLELRGRRSLSELPGSQRAAVTKGKVAPGASVGVRGEHAARKLHPGYMKVTGPGTNIQTFGKSKIVKPPSENELFRARQAMARLRSDAARQVASGERASRPSSKAALVKAFPEMNPGQRAAWLRRAKSNQWESAEGVAQAVVGAKAAPRAVSVRKTYDTGGAIYSKAQLARKTRAGRMLRDDPDFAKMLSKRLGKGKAGGRYHHYEFVPGKEVTETGTGLSQDYLSRVRSALAPGSRNVPAAQTRAQADLRKSRGTYGLGDIHTSNVKVTPGGKQKVIDYMVGGGQGRRLWNKFQWGNMSHEPPPLRAVGAPFKPVSDTLHHLQRYQKGKGAFLGRDMSPGSGGQFLLPPPGRAAAYYGPGGLRGKAAMWRKIYGTRTAPSDISWSGLRRADPVRALKGLGYGSPQKKLVKGEV